MKSKLKLFEISSLFNQFNVKLPLDEKVNIFLGENGIQLFDLNGEWGHICFKICFKFMQVLGEDL